MPKTIVVVGFGPGISTAVAERFGREGFSVALVARNAGRLEVGMAALKAKGIAAAAVPADASDPASIRGAIAKARAALGPITAIHWNAYSGAGIADIATTDPVALCRVFDVGITGLLSAVQEAMQDLVPAKDGAVLVTNGAFGELNPQVDASAIAMNSTGVALANAAKAKLVGLLSERLKQDGVYVGEVTVAGMVKGTPFDNGNATIDPATIAGNFWELYKARSEVRARVS
ncbi:MAG TPA: SDR family NAD(P)-dependent oxidoreductase [Rhizomicrobium sp.]|jgi:NAD(P)-dependent dehydrogenase (short-subunit alcohol dehydrogenase family)